MAILPSPAQLTDDTLGHFMSLVYRTRVAQYCPWLVWALRAIGGCELMLRMGRDANPDGCGDDWSIGDAVKDPRLTYNVNALTRREIRRTRLTVHGMIAVSDNDPEREFLNRFVAILDNACPPGPGEDFSPP